VLGRQRTGDETYMRHLLEGLAAVDQQNDYQVWLRHPQFLPVRARTRNMRPVKMNYPSVWLRIPLFQPLQLCRDPVDVLHVQYVAPPTSVPIVVTIHDLSFETYPTFFNLKDRFLFRTFVPYTAWRATRIITCSEHTKSDLVRHYGVPPDRVVVMPYGVDDRFFRIDRRDAQESVRTRYQGLEKFILFVGALQPRKNVIRLIEAFHWLRASSDLSHKLVIVGKKKYLYEQIRSTVRERGLEDEIVFSGHVSEDDLLSFYGAADLLVFPSLFEGFGLPPLEAMACGTPVVCSHVTSLPEVVGDAALLVDPHDTQGIGRAMLQVLTDANLRRQLIAKGLEQSRLFRWENTARRTLEVYQLALQDSSPRR